jgi:hypothetical protein
VPAEVRSISDVAIVVEVVVQVKHVEVKVSVVVVGLTKEEQASETGLSPQAESAEGVGLALLAGAAASVAWYLFTGLVVPLGGM